MTATLRDPNEVPFFRGTTSAVEQAKAYTDAQIATLGGIYEPIGASAAAVAAHEALLDPHPQYLTPAEGNAAYEVINAVATHVALADPHPQYLTPAEGNAAYEVINAVATHVALADPHTQYARKVLNTDSATGIAEFSNNDPGTTAVPCISVANAGALVQLGINGVNSTVTNFGPASAAFVRSSTASGGMAVILGGTGNLNLQVGSTVALSVRGTSRRVLVGPTLPADNGVSALQVGAGGVSVGNTNVANANTLDWYQEGVWTPTLGGSTADGATTYTNQTGWYQRVGNVVFVNFRCSWSTTTATGTIFLRGLPFTCVDRTQGMIRWNGQTFVGLPYCYANNGDNSITIAYTQSGASLANEPMKTSGDVSGFMTYRVA